MSFAAAPVDVHALEGVASPPAGGGSAQHESQARHVVQGSRHARRPSRLDAGAINAFAAAPAGASGSVVAEARRHIGTNPTGRSALWCATFMNQVLQRTGHKGTNSNLARSFASYGQRVSGPQVGAIAVMSRGRGGGHVGVVSGVDASGNPIVISGNHGRRVAEAVYPRGRVMAYVLPN